MSKITVYEKPTCTTCRKVAKAFSDQGINFENINYYIKPFSKFKLQSLLKKMGIKPSELLRKNDAAYKNLKNQIEKLNENEILNLLVKNPDLIQRPIIEKGSKAILARPFEKLNEIL